MQKKKMTNTNTCSYSMILGDDKRETTRHVANSLKMDKWIVFSRKKEFWDHFTLIEYELEITKNFIRVHTDYGKQSLGLIFDDTPLKILKKFPDLIYSGKRHGISIIFRCNNVIDVTPFIRANLDFVVVYDVNLEMCKKIYKEYLSDQMDRFQEFVNLQKDNIIVINNSHLPMVMNMYSRENDDKSRK